MIFNVNIYILKAIFLMSLLGVSLPATARPLDLNYFLKLDGWRNDVHWLGAIGQITKFEMAVRGAGCEDRVDSIECGVPWKPDTYFKAERFSERGCNLDTYKSGGCRSKMEMGCGLVDLCGLSNEDALRVLQKRGVPITGKKIGEYWYGMVWNTKKDRTNGNIVYLENGFLYIINDAWDQVFRNARATGRNNVSKSDENFGD